MRTWQLLLVASVGLVALTGCPPAYPKCSTDEHCTEKGEVCVQGQCQECAADTHCKPGFVCDANKCVPKPECTDKTPCGPGKRCKGGRCQVDKPQREPGTCAADADCPSGEECKEGRCASRGAGAGSGQCTLEPIRFEFNEAKLSGEGQTLLGTLADCIKKNNWKLRLEGHADERGTEEYNLQLSNRRAASVKRYLTDLGVDGSWLETVGYGENKPAQNASSEAAWAANRRVELVKR